MNILTWLVLVVLSGSMEPAIKTGSIVVIKPEIVYKIGDVVTFQNSDYLKVTVTHRIFSIKNGSFVTKGDANKTPDIKEVSEKQILGKVFFVIPLLGYLVNFAKTQQGLIILIIIPSVIIVYNELINIKNEAVRLIRGRKK